jgi:hypothetical protein
MVPLPSVPLLEVGLPGETKAKSQVQPSEAAEKLPSGTGNAVSPPGTTEER